MILGKADQQANYVYLSDGSDFDNTGLYELMRGRCRYIIVCDAEEDGCCAFAGIGESIRECRIGLGAEIDLEGMRSAADGTRRHFSVGSVRYATHAGDANDLALSQAATLVFRKSSTLDVDRKPAQLRG